MRKNMIGALAILILSAGVALSAQQQGGMNGSMGDQMNDHTGGQMHGRMHARSIDQRVAKMKSDLNLTDQQAGQVKDLFEGQKQEMQSWRDNHPQASQSDMRAQHRQMTTEWNEGLKKILTSDQFKKFETMRRHRMGKGMGAPPQAPPGN